MVSCGPGSWRLGSVHSVYVGVDGVYRLGPRFDSVPFAFETVRAQSLTNAPPPGLRQIDRNGTGRTEGFRPGRLLPRSALASPVAKKLKP
jgi:hypothetical protein